MSSDEIERIKARIGGKVGFTYPGSEGKKLGILKDRAVVKGGKVGSVQYWDVVDLIAFQGEKEPMIRIGYYRKPTNRLNWGSQTTITEPISIWKRMLIETAREKKWFYDLLQDVMSELNSERSSL